MISKFIESETVVLLVTAESRSECLNHGLYFFVRYDSVDSGFFNIENLPFERKYGLELPIASHFCTTPRTVALNEKNFAFTGVFLLTVGQFSRQSATVHYGFSSSELACFPGGFPGNCRIHTFLGYFLSYRRILLEEHVQMFVYL